MRSSSIDDYFDTKYRPNTNSKENRAFDRYNDSDDDTADVMNYFSQSATQRRLDKLQNLRGVSRHDVSVKNEVYCQVYF